MNTLIKPRVPMSPEPSREDDPTGVRALLSSLPQPDPMPEHLVERITASLAAEQAQRAAAMSSSSVTPLLARARRRPSRLVFAIAGVAAAVAVIAVVGSNMFTVSQRATISGSAALASTSSAREAGGGTHKSAAEQAPPLADSGAIASGVQIRLSQTRYTQAAFVTQARTMLGATPGPSQPQAVSGVGPAATATGLMECLRALGASGAQGVRADVARYEGRPAVIIVATSNGISIAYVVGLQCSPADAAILRPATPLP